MSLRLRPSRRTAIAAVAAVAATGLGAVASADTSLTVTTAGIAGTRTLTVLSLSGDQLTSLPLVSGVPSPFLAQVTDFDYARKGYQVSATMSDLYPHSTSGYDFSGAPIPSSAVSLSYLSGGLTLKNVTDLVQPVFTLSLPAGAGGLVALTAPVTAKVSAAAQDITTLTGTLTDGLAAALPITLKTGDTGAFTNPAQIPGGPAVSGTTMKTLMSGDPQDTAATLTTTLQGLYDGKAASALTSPFGISSADLLAAIESASPTLATLLQGATSTVQDAVLSGLTVTDTELTAVASTVDGLIGQSGLYTTVPALTVTTPSTTPLGAYQGVLTVTLADTAGIPTPH